MDDDKRCPRCGSALPLDASAGTCSRCATLATIGKSAGASVPGTEVPTLLDTPFPPFLQGTPQDSALRETPTRYSPLGEHSRGGMGRILLVHDQSIGRNVALKELLPPDGAGSDDTPMRHSAALTSRFLREARLTGQLEHPGIVPVYEVGQRVDGTFYYTMKLVRGETLRGVLRKMDSLDGRIKLVPHVVDLCQAVAYAHSRGIIHRDLKPDNVMIGEFGETVVIDWGIAKVRGHDGATDAVAAPSERSDAEAGVQTENGSVLGTPAYMSPEQASGDLTRVDERSDVYALGAVLYEVLTGRPVFSGRTVAEVIYKVINESPQPVRMIERRVPRELAAICERALSRAPSARFASAGEMAEALQSFVSGRIFGPREARRSFLTGVYGFGVALVASGLFILAHYQVGLLPAWVRMAALLSGVLALDAAGVYFAQGRGRPRLGESLLFVGAILLGAAVFFRGTIGDAESALAHPAGWALWAGAALAVAYLARSTCNAVVAAGAGFVWFALHATSASPSVDPQGYPWWFPFLAAAGLLPFAYLRGSRSVFAMTLVLIGASVPLTAVNDGQMFRVWLAIVACCALIFPWGLLSYASARYRKFAHLATGFSTYGLAIAIAMISSQDTWERYASFQGWAHHSAYDPDLIPVIAVSAIAVVLWCLSAARHFVWRELQLLALAFLASAGLVVTGLTGATLTLGNPALSERLGHWISFVAIDLAALVLGGTAAWTGVILESRRAFLSSCFFIVVITLLRLFQSDMSMKGKAAVMVALGLAVIAAGAKFQRVLKKRHLI